MTTIMGRPTLDYAALEAAARAQDSATLFWESVVPALWAACLRYGIDPVAAVAQSGHETAWGRFPRLTQPWHRNTCGLKLRDFRPTMAALGIATSEHALCHQQFASWDEGAEAHAQHLRAYCQVPVAGLIVDPRYPLVMAANASTGRAPAVSLRDLDAWAGAEGYGDRLELAADRLYRAAGA